MNTATRGKQKVGALLSRTSVAVGGITGAVNQVRLVGRTASVAPTTGTFAVGDVVVTTSGAVYVCTVAGTPGTWVAGTAGPTASLTALTLAGPLIFTPSAVAALALDVTAGPVYTKSVAGASTFTASTGGTAGQVIWLIIATDGTQRVATFGTNLNSSGTLTIPASKVGTIQFVSDGTAFREVGRSINT